MRISIFVFLIFLGVTFIDGRAMNQLAFSAKKTRRVAVANLFKNNIKGTINFTQERMGAPIVIRGIIRGLAKGRYFVYLHENGDASSNCRNLGSVYKFPKVDKKFQTSNLARLGYIQSNSNNNAIISLISRFATLSGPNNIMNRGLAIQLEDSKNPSIILCGAIRSINSKN